ncbi:MAG: hypothetical protein DMD81_00720, partial [Candidatus Rokuibacteriota bacterium]
MNRRPLLCAFLLFAVGCAVLIPARARAQLPITTLDGILHIIWADPHPQFGSGGAVSYALELSDGTHVPLQLTGQDALATHHFRKRVQVSGRLVRNAVPHAATTSSPHALVVDSIASVSPPEETEAPLASVEAMVSGTRSIIYLLLQFADDADVPHPPTFYTNLTNPTTPPSGELFPSTINGFFNKTSWGQFAWT